MRLAIHDDLWVLGDPVDAPAPLMLAVDATGAVLEWPLDAAAESLPVVTLLDAGDADWMWRLIGEQAHTAILEAVAAGQPAEIDITINTAVCVGLHRLARVLWARAWWPASTVDGIPALSPTVLTAELAALADDLDAVLGDRFDPVAELAGCIPQELGGLADDPDVEVRAVATRAAELLEDAGLSLGPAVTRRRHDFALAAHGHRDADRPDVIASGAAAVQWQGVPAGVLDATEFPVRWSVEARGTVELTVEVATHPASTVSPRGIRVTATPPNHTPVHGDLGETGVVVLPLTMSAQDAWSQDWRELVVTVGTAVTEDAQVRARVRDHARRRLHGSDRLTLVAEHQVMNRDF